MDERLRFVARLLVEGENDRIAPTGSSADHSVLILLSVTPMFTRKGNPGAGPGSSLGQIELRAV